MAEKITMEMLHLKLDKRVICNFLLDFMLRQSANDCVFRFPSPRQRRW